MKGECYKKDCQWYNAENKACSMEALPKIASALDLGFSVDMKKS
jgi:hypothetical protein